MLSRHSGRTSPGVSPSAGSASRAPSAVRQLRRSALEPGRARSIAAWTRALQHAGGENPRVSWGSVAGEGGVGRCTIQALLSRGVEAGQARKVLPVVCQPTSWVMLPVVRWVFPSFRARRVQYISV
jgi:hypothetical protein